MRIVRPREVCPRLKADCVRVYGLSLWSGCCERKVAAYGNVPLQTSRVLWGFPIKIGWYRGSIMLPSLFCGRELFLFFAPLKQKRIFKIKNKNFIGNILLYTIFFFWEMMSSLAAYHPAYGHKSQRDQSLPP